MSENTAKGMSGARSKVVLVLAVAVGVIVGGGVAYLVGFVQMKSALGAQHEVHAQEIAGITAQRDDAKAELAKQRARNDYLTARGWLFRSAAELDSRNFGTANDYVSRANASLSAVEANVIGLDPEAFTLLRGEISKLNITVAADLEQQRGTLLRLASALDQMMPQT